MPLACHIHNHNGMEVVNYKTTDRTNTLDDIELMDRIIIGGKVYECIRYLDA